MSDKSAIEWTDATWNPTTGCTKVSPGCAHCYIERTPAFRIPGNKFVHGKTDITIFHDRLEQPLHWRKPRRVFVNSLSDLFHDDISDAFIDQVFATMALTPRHTYQVLTKRPQRMRSYVIEARARVDVMLLHADDPGVPADRWPLPNVWLGVSVENQHFADERIPLLLQTPAAVRFISAEPLLGPVNVGPYLSRDAMFPMPGFRDPLPGLNWVIIGGESGPQSRPFDLAWAESLVAQCHAAGVACFVKQLGAQPVIAYGNGARHAARLRDKKGGNPDEWPIDLRVREYPQVP